MKVKPQIYNYTPVEYFKDICRGLFVVILNGSLDGEIAIYTSQQRKTFILLLCFLQHYEEHLANEITSN